MNIDDALQGIMAMIESGGLERCYICGEEKPGEIAIVGLVDENGKEHTESVCYDCMKRIPIANAALRRGEPVASNGVLAEESTTKGE